MTEEDFTVFIEPKELEPTQLVINNGGKRQLNVVAVDASLKTITLKYGGAYSGTYRLSIKSEANGSIDTHPLELLVVFQITGFSPKTGSVYGGTKLTITGGPFIPGDLSQTLIKVGPELQHFCEMISVEETVATCRLPPAADRAAGSYDVVAFASTYEESNCAVADGCKFTFAAPAPAVTGAATAFYPTLGANGEYHINIDGTGFPTDPTGIEVELAGTAQAVSASATQIVVRVDSLKSGLTASAVDLYLPGDYPGTPSGAEAGLPAAIKVGFEPQLVSLSTDTVSAAGSVITAAVWGVGPGDQVTLWDETGDRDFCAKRSMKAYGQLECQTIAEEVAPL